MLRKLSIALGAVLVLLSGATAAFAEEEPAAAAPEKSAAANVSASFAEIMDAMEKNCPAIVRDSLSAGTEKKLNDLLRAMFPGVEYREKTAPAEAKPAKNGKNGKQEAVKTYPMVIMSGNRLSYCRLDTATPDTFKQLRDDLAAAAKYTNKPCGVVLDIRNCSQGDYKSAVNIARLFSASELIPQTGDKADKVVDTPAAVLTSDKTSGPGELVASLLSASKAAILIGGKTANKIYPKTSVPLSNGASLLIPNPPDFLKETSVRVISPDIEEEPFPMQPYDKFKTPGEDKDDYCLTRAADLLISLRALESQWKKSPAAK